MPLNYSECHWFQRQQCNQIAGKILNVGCKEDPAHLGKSFDAVNLDCEDFDIETKTSLYSIPNFVLGSALKLPFDDAYFECVVLGEFLEHCPYQQAQKALEEAKRVLKPDGKIVLTFPLDSRPKEVQRPPAELREYEHGITSWHQTVWRTPLFTQLVTEIGGLTITEWTELRYPVLDYQGEKAIGYGVVLKKEAGNG